MKCILASIFFYSFSTDLFGFRVRLAVWPLVWLSSAGKASATIKIRRYEEIYNTDEIKILCNIKQRLWIARNSYLSIQIFHITLDAKRTLKKVSNGQNIKSSSFTADWIIIRILCKIKYVFVKCWKCFHMCQGIDIAGTLLVYLSIFIHIINWHTGQDCLKMKWNQKFC